MIAHLVRKMVPKKKTKQVVCAHCGLLAETESHQVIYCIMCGHALPLPPPRA